MIQRIVLELGLIYNQGDSRFCQHNISRSHTNPLYFQVADACFSTALEPTFSCFSVSQVPTPSVFLAQHWPLYLTRLSTSALTCSSPYANHTMQNTRIFSPFAAHMRCRVFAFKGVRILKKNENIKSRALHASTSSVTCWLIS